MGEIKGIDYKQISNNEIKKIIKENDKLKDENKRLKDDWIPLTAKDIINSLHEQNKQLQEKYDELVSFFKEWVGDGKCELELKILNERLKEIGE